GGGEVQTPYVASDERIGSPLLGNFLTYHSTSTNDNGVSIIPSNSLLAAGATFYWQMRTIDTGLMSSTWSAVQQIFVVADSSAPAAVTNLVASSGSATSTAYLSWSAPGDNGNSATLNGVFLIEYSTFSVSWSPTVPTGASSVSISTSNVAPGTGQQATI